MTATAAQISQVRRMVAEPTTSTYSDAAIQSYIEAHPMTDERGAEPFIWDLSSVPPHKDANDDWMATYDLNAAAADIWEEKAAALAGQYDFSTDGQSFSRSQAYQQAIHMVSRFKARRAMTSITLVPAPRAPQYDPTIGNLPEPEDM